MFLIVFENFFLNFYKNQILFKHVCILYFVLL